ncbi:MAG: hypothetical protein M3N33_07975 [Actinomycetota bacterium]|nr:hypothetical protein [Actinomycetota bacterium]
MNREPEPRRYKAGDNIRARLTIEHAFYFSRLLAVFEHEDFDPTIEGRGEETHAITLAGRNPEQLFRLDTVPATITSSALLEGTLGAEKAVVEYRCTLMEASH